MNIEPKLIDGCIKGDRKSEYELYKSCYSYLMGICVRYTRNVEKAKEVLNLGFYKIISNLDKYNTEAPFKAWARKVMINTLINEYKKDKIHYGNFQYVENYYESDKHADVNLAITRINVAQIYNLIARLPPASQQVFNLYYIDGFRHKEIAGMLRISEGTSKWHLNSAREKLKELITELQLTEKIA